MKNSGTPPIIAIIGRPNVGKSTLFNRLVGKKLALVDDAAGTTRDRRYGQAHLVDLDFQVIDTAGMEEGGRDTLTTRMLEQTKAAILEADILLFLIDARAGLTPADEKFAALARRSNKPVILAANKAEGRAATAALADLYTLGFDNVALISAEHGEGMGDLFDALLETGGWGPGGGKKDDSESTKRPRKKKRMQTDEAESSEPPAPGPQSPLKIVILGRPNAGKSTLVNAILGDDRLLTGPEAGITRDAIAVRLEHGDIPIELVDTAGMRKRARVEGKLEHLAVADAIRAMQYAEVVVVLLDATAPMEKQDAAIAALVEREGRACVIGLNKWDLVTGDKKAYLEEIRYLLNKQLSQLAGIPVVPVCATKQQGLDKLLNACLKARDVWNLHAGTAALNRWLEAMQQAHTPPLIRGRRLKIKYITQTKSRPPTFQLFANMAKEFPDAYKKYLVHGLRETFGMEGTPIRLILKGSGKNPFENKKK
ncbi:MAG: ribosome biogenesis GTPase Der [Alphaproteobacteria bacterium]